MQPRVPRWMSEIQIERYFLTGGGSSAGSGSPVSGGIGGHLFWGVFWFLAVRGACPGTRYVTFVAVLAIKPWMLIWMPLHLSVVFHGSFDASAALPACGTFVAEL